MAELETRDQAARRMLGQKAPAGPAAPATPAISTRSPQPICISPVQALRLGFYAGLGALIAWLIPALIYAALIVRANA